MNAYRIGVDLGGTNIAAGLVDENYCILKKKSIKTNLPRTAEAVCEDIAALCRTLCEEADIAFDDIAHIGIGSPGIICRGVVNSAANLGFHNAPVADMVAKLTGKPVSLKNDGNAAALGELVAGCGKGKSSLIAVTIGTGVGGGVILNNTIIEGFNGAAGEVGHIIIEADGRPCGCGSRGCFETYCSASALIRDTKEAMLAHPESALHTLAPTLDEVNGKTAFDGMRLGDKVATAVVENFINMLAVGVSSLIQLLQPEIICIGGGVAAEGDYLLLPLREKVVAKTLAGADGMRTTIVCATLGNDAGIIGAAV